MVRKNVAGICSIMSRIYFFERTKVESIRIGRTFLDMPGFFYDTHYFCSICGHDRHRLTGMENVTGLLSHH